jgi:hypothetical protein
VRDVGAIAFAGHHGFFEAQPLGVDEVPDRPIIDLEAALGEFGDKSAQGEVPCLGALQQPGCEVSSSLDADATAGEAVRPIAANASRGACCVLTAR